MKQYKYLELEFNEMLFTIYDIDFNFNKIYVNKSQYGKLSLIEYQLLCDKNGYFFEIDFPYKKLYIEDFN